MESTKESLPDEEETTKSSRDRLQDLPEGLRVFAENLRNQDQRLQQVTVRALPNLSRQMDIPCAEAICL